MKQTMRFSILLETEYVKHTMRASKMELKYERLVVVALIAANFISKVHGYCMPGTGTRILYSSYSLR